MKATDTPDKVLKYWAVSAADPANVNVIPENSPGTPGRASFDQGFPPETMVPIGAGGTPPFGQDENGILRFVTRIEQWANAGGLFGYDATFSTAIGGYPKGAILNSALANGAYWISTTDDNVTNPDSSGAGWVTFTPLALTSADTGTKNAVAIAILPNAPNAFFVGRPVTVQKGSATNDGPVTINYNTNGALPVVHPDGSALTGGELPGNGYFTGVLDSSGNFELLSGSSGRQRLANNLTLYVNGSTGDNTNDGLTTGTAFATTQRAWDVVFTNYDLNGFQVSVSIADFAYTSGVTANGRLVGSKTPNSMRFFSASGNAAACTFTAANNTFNASDGSEYSIQDIKISSTGANGINVSGFGRIDIISGVIFGACSSSHIAVQSLGRVNVNGDYTISGNAVSHYNEATNGVITVTPPSATVITVSGTPAFTQFALVQMGAQLLFSNTTFSGSATGQRYLATLGGVINTNGGGANFLPGNSAGSVTPGGQYA